MRADQDELGAFARRSAGPRAAPMPREAPVTRAMRPASRPGVAVMQAQAVSASSESWAATLPPLWSVSAVG